ncbi:MAG: hypothetical protein U1E59_20300 [Amaricoccus sp.]
MKRGLEWYKRDPQAIRMAIMAARMTVAQAAVYSLIIDLIYEGGGETPNQPQHVAAHFADIGAAKARRTIEELIGMGKLFLVDGMLHEKRAETEAKTCEKLRENRAEFGRKGGISSGFSRTIARENNDIREAKASSKNEADKDRDIEGEKNTPLTPQCPAAQKAAPSALVSEFERVWPYYPRQVGVGAARKAWVKARAKASYETIAASLRVFIPAVKGTPVDKIPHFATWLKGERWNDDHTHAANRGLTSTDDLRGLATISAADDVARLMATPKAIAR